VPSESTATSDGFIASLIGDGRPLLSLVALSLLFSGGFALFQSATGQFLPHDIQYLGMDPAQLCGVNQGRVVHFMFHDRVSFGGTLMALGALYLWLIHFPLGQREDWAWWLFLVSGITGFGSFLAYLGYGYLDSWHGVATLLLLVPYGWGMARTRRVLGLTRGIGVLRHSCQRFQPQGGSSTGRMLLLGTGLGMLAAGVVIMIVGMTRVFVPQDLTYMGLGAADLNAINPRLIPLIAHDRAGFGGGLGTVGLVLFFCVWCGRPSRSLWQAILLAGGVGFTTAIGIHPVIGYTSFSHLLPAYIGALMFLAGMILSRPGAAAA